MKFEKFKKIFLTYVICEVEFSFVDSDKSKIRIQNYNPNFVCDTAKDILYPQMYVSQSPCEHFHCFPRIPDIP